MDDAESECGLDEGVDFDIIIKNNSDEELQHNIQHLLAEIKRKTNEQS